MKKGIRIDTERVDKLYKLLDTALRSSELRFNGAELLAVCYQLLKNVDMAQAQKIQAMVPQKR